MFEILNTVEIAGKKLPIKCDFNVLQVIQEQFGTLKNFEQKLIGINPKTDKDGNQIYKTDSNGEEVLDYTVTEPSLKAIAVALPLMLKEGRIQADEQGETANKDFDYMASIREADFSMVQVAIELHTEYKRCFERKKLKARRLNPTKK